jgi:hypothetical protein
LGVAVRTLLLLLLLVAHGEAVAAGALVAGVARGAADHNSRCSTTALVGITVLGVAGWGTQRPCSSSRHTVAEVCRGAWASWVWGEAVN